LKSTKKECISQIQKRKNNVHINDFPFHLFYYKNKKSHLTNEILCKKNGLSGDIGFAKPRIKPTKTSNPTKACQ